MSNPDDSILKVRRSTLIAASPAQVWTAFTSQPRMHLWWGKKIAAPIAGQPNGQTLIAYEPRRGGKIEMEVLAGGAPLRYGGTIVVFDPERELSFENDWIPNQGWTRPTIITLRLSPALGGTLVELFHHGFEHVGGKVAAEFEGYESGWGMLQLSSLRALIEGERA